MIYEPERDEDSSPQRGDESGYGPNVGTSTVPPQPSSIAPDTKTERLNQLMLTVIDGSISRGRSLKYWENLKLNPRHIQMLVMKAAGFTNNYIAAEFEMSASRVSVIVNHPDSQEILSKIISFQAEELVDVRARLKAHAAEALDISLNIMRNSKEDSVRLKATFGLLDRAGYGAVQRSEAKVEVSIPASAANAISQALRESQQVEDADWEVAEETDSPTVQGNSTAGETGGSFEETQCAGEPPFSGQPMALARRVA